MMFYYDIIIFRAQGYMILVNKRKESVFSVLDLDTMAENESKVAKPYECQNSMACVCIKLLVDVSETFTEWNSKNETSSLP